MKKYVMFLDLLGFKNYVNEDTGAASELLHDISNLLQIQESDNEFGKEIDVKFQTTGFDDFIPMSDSIIITSQDVSLMLSQISHFLKSCLDISLKEYLDVHYSSSCFEYDNPLKRDIKNLEGETIEVTRYPLLFRGGGTYGHFETIKVFTKINLEFKPVFNFYGDGFINAYKMESSGFKGPRLMLSEDFFNSADNSIKHLFMKQPSFEIYEFLWMYTIYIKNNTAKEEIKKINDYLVPAIKLWKYYQQNNNVVEQYYEFICLIIKSTLKHFSHVWGTNGLSIARNHIDNLIKSEPFYPEVKVIIYGIQ